MSTEATTPDPRAGDPADPHELIVEAFAALVDRELWSDNGRPAALAERLEAAEFAGILHSEGRWTFVMAGHDGVGISLRAAMSDWHARQAEARERATA